MTDVEARTYTQHSTLTEFRYGLPSSKMVEVSHRKGSSMAFTMGSFFNIYTAIYLVSSRSSIYIIG